MSYFKDLQGTWCYLDFHCPLDWPPKQTRGLPPNPLGVGSVRGVQNVRPQPGSYPPASRHPNFGCQNFVFKKVKKGPNGKSNYGHLWTMTIDYSRQNLHKDKKCQRRWNLPWLLALKATGARTRLRTNAEVAAHNRCFCTWWSWVVSDILAPHIPWHPSEPSTSS